jgi:hypothetical protein
MEKRGSMNSEEYDRIDAKLKCQNIDKHKVNQHGKWLINIGGNRHRMDERDHEDKWVPCKTCNK